MDKNKNISYEKPQEYQGLFIDLFAGCGGFSVGLMNSGWRGLFAIEKEKNAFETLQHNLIEGTYGYNYEWPIWLPKSNYRIGAFIKKYKRNLIQLRGQVDLIVGGPPCQGFSLVGRRKKDDYRNMMFKHYVEIVDLIRPPLLLMENVRGIAVEHGKEKRNPNKKKIGRPSKSFAQRIKQAIEDLGYHVYPGILKSVDFGVPQLRPRYFMFGINSSFLINKDEVNPFELVETQRPLFLTSKGLPDRPISVGEAISDLEIHGKELVECVDSPCFEQIAYKGPETYYQVLLNDAYGIPPNSLRLAKHRPETRAKFTKILETCRRGVSLSEEKKKILGIKKHCIVPLDANKPSHTLTTLPDDFLHYSEPRILTVRENARLQSFPDWFEFKGKYTTGGKRRIHECPRYTQVGNAVPPLFAECLGIVLRGILKELSKKPQRITNEYLQFHQMEEVCL